MAAAAEERKKSKYACLDQCHQFVPVAVETSGVFVPGTLQFLWELGQRLRQVSSDANACSYLIQHLSVGVQQGNRASVLGSTSGHSPNIDIDFS